LTLIAAMMAGILVLLFGSSACSPGGSSGTVETVKYGLVPVEASALFFVAEDQHYFAANGIDFSEKTYDTGLASANGMLQGEVDIGSAAEFAIVGKLFNKENMALFGTFDKAQTIYIIGRKDRGVTNLSDLKGKRIGIVRQTVLEFYLGRFLDLQGIGLQNVTLVDVKAPQYEDAIVNGNLDAIICNQPYVDAIRNRLGNNGVVWPAQSSQLTNSILICKPDLVTNHPETIIKFLKALNQGEKYLVSHPAEAKALVQKRLKYTDAYMEAVWPQHQFSLSLDFSLLVTMDDEAHWLIINNLTAEKSAPDFSKYIYLDGLKAVDSKAVNITK
jgi:ABC-type nitrate/sulfonate/bicarbonate transport system substrate-binding protein